MFDHSATKIIELLIQSDYVAASNELVNLENSHPFFSIFNYFILTSTDSKKAISYWNETNKDAGEPIFNQTIEAYNLYISKSFEQLESFVLARVKQPIYNFVEASNLSFYAHTLQLNEQKFLLSKAKELTVSSELLVPEEQIDDFKLFHPIILLKVHYQAIQFLKSNFENEHDLQLFMENLKKEKPV
jgi:hypothetical protein